MLKQLELFEYRGFDQHKLELRSPSVIVGHNNAGKSTIVEALRIISILTSRLGGLNFRDPPPWTGLPMFKKGLTPSLEGLGIQFRTITHQYNDQPARLKAVFTSGESVEILIDTNGRAFATLTDPHGELIRTKNRSLKATFPSVEVLPQISPLDTNETVLVDEYVRRNFSSPLSSRHFRNQLRIENAAYRKFRQLAQDTWQGIQIIELEGARGNPGQELRLLVRDHAFAAEVGLMGHGLQMWLQTMWFLSRCREESTVVLDEPDVYMHPDLQRKLIRIVRNMYPQVIVATHSIEIIADLDPSEILIVDRGQRESKFADTLPAVQRLINNIGGIHNVHLARLWSSRKCILVEGEDLSYLKRIHDLLYPSATYALDDVPNSSIGGWSGWRYAIGQSMLAKNSLGQSIKVYCIFDSDYHTPKEINDRYKEAKGKKVELHIWERKEIENYFINADLFSRVIFNRDPTRNYDDIRDAVETELKRIVLSLEHDVFDAYAASYRDLDPKGGVKKANQKSRDLLKGVFNESKKALNRVPGKEVIKQFSSWAHATYGRGISLRDVLREIRASEVPEELRKVVQSLETNKGFNL